MDTGISTISQSLELSTCSDVERSLRADIFGVRSGADDEDDSLGRTRSREILECSADSCSVPVIGLFLDKQSNEVMCDRFIEHPNVPSSSPGLGQSVRRLSSTCVYNAGAAVEIQLAVTTPALSLLRHATDAAIGLALPSSCSVSTPTCSKRHRRNSVTSSGNDGHSLADEVEDLSYLDAMGRWRDRAKSSSSSVAALAGLNKVELTELFNNKQASSAFMFGKMLAVAGLPALTLVVLTGLLLWNAVSTQAVSRLAIGDLRRFLSVDDLVTNIQVERGTTATYLSSNGRNTAALVGLQSIYNLTDRLVEGLDTWPPKGLVVNGTFLADRQRFLAYLRDYRAIVGNLSVTFETNIHIYTEITFGLMDWSQSTINVPAASGTMWTRIATLGAELRASDYIGTQRALGSTYFTLCHINADNFVWFNILRGAERSMLQMAFSLNPALRTLHKETYIGTPLQLQLDAMRTLIMSPYYHSTCENMSVTHRYNHSLDWFNQMTTYMSLVKNARSTLANETMFFLNSLVNVYLRRQVIAYSITMAAVTMLSLVLSGWHTIHLNAIISRLTVESQRIMSETQQVSLERRRVVQLLNQMMPPSIIAQLEMGMAVEAEFFDLVTVYYSDIVGFTTISALSAPMQVVSMLNELFRIYDDCIDRHDVYKVATIGDAYLVVSGAPEHASDHAWQICRLAVDIRRAVSSFVIPHLPDHKFQQRIGLHSGPVVAGVVGTRSFRYSIFGETVSLANKMESSGKPGWIQVSETTAAEIGKMSQNTLVLQLRKPPVDGVDFPSYWLID